MDIRLTKRDKHYIEGTEDVYAIMQRILLRENKVDQEKEHLWMIGMNQAGYILYIELIALGTFRSVDIEPMNVFRVAVMKNASRVILIHNHPSGSLIPSDNDKDVTDRLIQVGRILNIELTDHLIITPFNYLSFRAEKLMDKLEKSIKYVPTYKVIEQIRKEERKITREKLAIANNKIKAEKDKTKLAREKAKTEKERRKKLEYNMIITLFEKDISITDIAKIMGITTKKIEKVIVELKIKNSIKLFTNN